MSTNRKPKPLCHLDFLGLCKKDRPTSSLTGQSVKRRGQIVANGSSKPPFWAVKARGQRGFIYIRLWERGVWVPPTFRPTEPPLRAEDRRVKSLRNADLPWHANRKEIFTVLGGLFNVIEENSGLVLFLRAWAARNTTDRFLSDPAIRIFHSRLCTLMRVSNHWGI